MGRTISRRHAYKGEWRFCNAAFVASAGAEHPELAGRRIVGHLMQQPGLQAGAATEAEITVAPVPASTAAYTASFDGSSSKPSNTSSVMRKRRNAAPSAARVLDPRSRSTQSSSASSARDTDPQPIQGWPSPTTNTSRSCAALVLSSDGSYTSPSTNPESAVPAHTAAVTCAVLPTSSRRSIPGW